MFFFPVDLGAMGGGLKRRLSNVVPNVSNSKLKFEPHQYQEMVRLQAQVAAHVLALDTMTAMGHRGGTGGTTETQMPPEAFADAPGQNRHVSKNPQESTPPRSEKTSPASSLRHSFYDPDSPPSSPESYFSTCSSLDTLDCSDIFFDATPTTVHVENIKTERSTRAKTEKKSEKKCAKCGEERPEKAFSKKQWKLRENVARCSNCTKQKITYDPGLLEARKFNGRSLDPPLYVRINVDGITGDNLYSAVTFCISMVLIINNEKLRAC